MIVLLHGLLRALLPCLQLILSRFTGLCINGYPDSFSQLPGAVGCPARSSSSPTTRCHRVLQIHRWLSCSFFFFKIKEEGAFSSLFAYSHYFIEGCRVSFKSYFCSCICLLESFSLTPPVPSCWDYRCGPCLSKPRAEHCVLVFTKGVQILCQLSYTLSYTRAVTLE